MIFHKPLESITVSHNIQWLMAVFVFVVAVGALATALTLAGAATSHAS